MSSYGKVVDFAEIHADELRATNERLQRENSNMVDLVRTQASRYETALANISQGVCFFDRDQRLILCNRRYTEIYHLTPEQARPGSTLREIAQSRFSAGTCLTPPDEYLALCAAINTGGDSRIWSSELKDGRTIHVCHQPMPDGGWVATHEDITELKANRVGASERISLQTLIYWVPDYLWVKDVESRFLVANKAIASDNGISTPSEMIGLTDLDLHTAEVAREFRDL